LLDINLVKLVSKIHEYYKFFNVKVLHFQSDKDFCTTPAAFKFHYFI